MSSSTSSEFITQFIGKAVNCVKVANSIPVEHGYQYLATFPDFLQKSDELKHKVANIMAKMSSQVSRLHPASRAAFIDPNDSVRFNALVETVDDAFEQVTRRLKRHRDNGSSDAPVLGQTLDAASKRTKPEIPLALGALAKPQLKFKTPVDNSANPWKPTIRTKPNARRPLQDIFTRGNTTSNDSNEASVNGQNVLPSELSSIQDHLEKQYGLPLVPTDTAVYPHPYSYELDNIQYPSSQLQACHETLYKSLAETKCHFISNVTELEILEKKLTEVTEFAVDLEHHSYRTYLGITCLMQISTRSEDFLVDAIALRDDLHILNSSFTDPNIVKVLHGAAMDIQWLQRDLGLYVVNLFDTAQAAKLLNFTSISLASLLALYCSVQADKKFQLADWRVRPLSAQLIHYARQDTHFLLFVYDRLKNELIQRSAEELRQSPNAPKRYGDAATVAMMSSSSIDASQAPFEPAHLLAVCLNRSREICLTRYVKPPCNLSTVQRIADFVPKMTPVQSRILTALVFWRDTVARHEDESPGYVLPTNTLIQLSLVCPQDSNSLRDVCKPMTPLLNRYAGEIISMIQRVIATYLTGGYSTQPTLAPTLSTSFMDDMVVVDKPNAPILPPAKRKSIRAGETSAGTTSEDVYNDAGWVAGSIHSKAKFQMLDGSGKDMSFEDAAKRTAHDITTVSAFVNSEDIYGSGSELLGLDSFDLTGLSLILNNAARCPQPLLLLAEAPIPSAAVIGDEQDDIVPSSMGSVMQDTGALFCDQDATEAQKLATSKHQQVSNSFSLQSFYTIPSVKSFNDAKIMAHELDLNLTMKATSAISPPSIGSLDVMNSPNQATSVVPGLGATVSSGVAIDAVDSSNGVADVYKVSNQNKFSEESRLAPIRQQKSNKKSVGGQKSDDGSNGFISGHLGAVGISDNQFMEEIGWTAPTSPDGEVPSPSTSASTSMATEDQSCDGTSISTGSGSGSILPEGTVDRTKHHKSKLPASDNGLTITPFVYNEKNDFAAISSKTLAQQNESRYFNPNVQHGQNFAAKGGNSRQSGPSAFGNKKGKPGQGGSAGRKTTGGSSDSQKRR